MNSNSSQLHLLQTPVYRFFHLDNLRIYLSRRALHSPNSTPDDGEFYRTIHEEKIQKQRASKQIPCGPQGVIHDYVPFYFCVRSPMLLSISNHQNQDEIVYVRCYAQDLTHANCAVVFSDGHGIMKITQWYDSFQDLMLLDWDTINSRYWADTPEDPDKRRRKQAEFLVYNQCPWGLVNCIAVLNSAAEKKVRSIMGQFNATLTKEIIIQPDWYYL